MELSNGPYPLGDSETANWRYWNRPATGIGGEMANMLNIGRQSPKSPRDSSCPPIVAHLSNQFAIPTGYLVGLVSAIVPQF